MASLSLRHIGKTYENGFHAVGDVSLEIADKELMVLVGPPDCGKSTVLRMIAGLEDISCGEICMEDGSLNNVDIKDREMAMVFKNYALYEQLSVFDNLAFSLVLRKEPEKMIAKKVNKVAEMIGLKDKLAWKAEELGEGDGQLVAVGRALVKEAKVVLFDEPFSQLEPDLKTKMIDIIKKIHDQTKTTMVYVTQDQEEAVRLGTRIAVMKSGMIEQLGTPKDVFEHPVNRFVAGYIGKPEMNFSEALVKQEESKLYLDLGGHKIFLPKEKGEKLIQGEYIDKAVIMGVRQEDISSFVLESEEIYAFDTKTEIAIFN